MAHLIVLPSALTVPPLFAASLVSRCFPWRRGITLLTLCLALACSSGPGAETGVELSVVSGERLSAVPPLLTLRLEGLDELSPEDIWLLEGTLSSSSAKRLAQGEVPVTAADARVPLASFFRDGSRHLKPLELLAPSTPYTLVGLGVGRIGSFSTSAAELSTLRRWGQGTLSPGGSAWFCSLSSRWGVREEPEGSAPAGPGAWRSVELADPSLRASARRLSPECLELRVDPDFAEKVVLLPTELLGEWIAPGTLQVTSAPLPGSMAGTATEDVFRQGLGGLELQVPPGAHQVSVTPESAPPHHFLFETEEEAWLPLGALRQGPTLVELRSLSTAGTTRSSEHLFVEEQSRGRLVLTEVLANPVGPEPQGEWVELLNDGHAPVDLLGLAFRDAGGEVPLPEVRLAPGERALLAREDYSVDPELDTPPEAETVPLLVPELGTAGLSNSGELLRLVDELGQEVSRIPPISSEPGISVARWHPLAPSVLESFAPHGPPGASPGSVNRVSAP